MGLFGSVLGTVFDVVTSPIAVVKDVVTLGGSLTDENEPYTIQQLKKLDSDVKQIGSDLGDL